MSNRLILIFLFLSCLAPMTSFAKDPTLALYSDLERRDITNDEVKDMVTNLREIHSIVKDFGPQSGPCPNSFDENSRKKVWKMHSNENDKNLILTDLNMDAAVKAFNKVKNNRRVPTNINNPNAQAHMVNIILEENGIISGKVFIEGKIYSQTRRGEELVTSSVAAFVLVNRVPYVIDPSNFDGPVTYGTWKDKTMNNPKSKFNNMYFTTRYAYDTSDKFKDHAKYRVETLEGLNDINLRSCNERAQANNLNPVTECASK